MPNHVTHRVTIKSSKETIQKIKDTHFSKDEKSGEINQFDFNTFIPMPTILADTTSGTSADLGYMAITGKFTAPNGRLTWDQYGMFRDKNFQNFTEFKEHIYENHPDFIAEGQKLIDAIKETGFADWYTWSISNWNTKWNSYSLSIDDNQEDGTFEFNFETAWSTPTSIFEKLCERYPEIELNVSFFDEGWGFAGTGYNDDGSYEESDEEITDEFFETVYGHKPYKDDEEEVAE